MNKKIIVVASIGLVIGLVLGIFISLAFNLHNVLFPSQMEQQKIFCNADENKSSGWFRSYPENRSRLDSVVSAMNETEVPSLEITVTNPYVSLWDTKKAVYNEPDTHWVNGTVCTLNLDDINTVAYGYAQP